MSNCIFCKIARHEIPKEFIYEDEEIMVFPDINPIKPTHLLVVPKKHVEDILNLEDDVLTNKLRKVVQKIASESGLVGKGFRVTINGGGAQAINHLHIHITGPWGLAVKD